MSWFYQQSQRMRTLYQLMDDKLSGEDENTSDDDDDDADDDEIEMFRDDEEVRFINQLTMVTIQYKLQRL